MFVMIKEESEHQSTFLLSFLLTPKSSPRVMRLLEVTAQAFRRPRGSWLPGTHTATPAGDRGRLVADPAPMDSSWLGCLSGPGL